MSRRAFLRMNALQMTASATPDDPNVTRFIREPGHIECDAGLGLGVYDHGKIQHREIRL